MSENKFLIVIGGPTASGKTSFAIEMAQHFNTEIISCDSRQFYREMEIGTAKPTTEELVRVKHHFVNSLSVTDNYSVGDFEQEAIALLDQLFQKRDVVILCGGSGLYIGAVCFGLDYFPEVPQIVKKQVVADYEARGITALQEELKERDPDYFKVVDLKNPNRLMRAVEVIRATGKTFSSFRTGKDKQRPFRSIFLQLHHPRETLYRRINHRVDLMMENGLEQEVRSLYPYHGFNAMRTVGYQELIPYLEGKGNLDNAVDQIKQNTRRYAKRQITWMRNQGYWKHIRPDDFSLALDYINMVIDKKLQFKVSAPEGLDLEIDTTYPKSAKVLTATTKNSLAGYFAYEKKPNKTIWHPIQMLSGDEMIKRLLEHEQVLIKEEFGM
jgi:tRNA dimethylallyltransferase